MDANTSLFLNVNDFARAGLPSDHATMAGAVAAGLFLVNRRFGILAALAAVLMAFSRVYTAAHYPLDVAAGMLLGAAVSVAGWVLLRRQMIRVVQAVQRTRRRPLLVATRADPGPET